MKKLTKYQRKLFKLIFGGVLYTVLMIVGSYLLGLFVEENKTRIPIYLMIVMLLMVVVYIYRIIIAKRKEKLLFIRYGVLITLFAFLAVSSILALYNDAFYFVVGVGYAVGIMVDRSFSLAHHHKGRNIFLAIVLYIYALLLIILFVVPNQVAIEGANTFIVYVLVPITLIFTSFIDAVKLVFSGLRRQTLMGIIKKTYTIEILYGLLTLMVAISIMLMVVEDGFNNYGDALWYCFAVVTTIGFGDFTVTTIVGRMLSVILGIYGIIVVALITSIIVNFYNETSHHETDEEIKESIKQLDEDRKPVKEEEEDKE